MKHYLALSGGGMKGAFQVGAVDYLRSQGIKFSGVSGISVGALNGALIAQDKIDELIKLWQTVVDTDGGVITSSNLGSLKEGKLKLDFKKIFDVATHDIKRTEIASAIISSIFKGRRLEELLTKAADNLDFGGSLLDNKPLYKTLLEYIKIADFKMPYYFGVTSLQSSLGLEFNHKQFFKDEELARAVLASATMPVIWDPVPKFQSKMNTPRNVVDGGLRTVSPIGQIFDSIDKQRDEATIWVINCNAQNLTPVEDFSRKSTIVGRLLDILLNQVFIDDLKMTLYINENAEKLGKTKVTINIIEPEPNTIGGTLDARKEVIDARIDMGRALASNYFTS
jgi:NTE family protein